MLSCLFLIPLTAVPQRPSSQERARVLARVLAKPAYRAAMEHISVLAAPVQRIMRRLEADPVPSASRVFGQQDRWSTLEYTRRVPACIRDVREHIGHAMSAELQGRKKPPAWENYNWLVRVSSYSSPTSSHALMNNQLIEKVAFHFTT